MRTLSLACALSRTAHGGKAKEDDMDEQSDAMAGGKDNGDKPKTAVEGNAPGGQAFQDPNNPVASGGKAVLGAQVRPENQLDSDNGGRTLAKPVTDPGPYIPEDQHQFKHPDPNQGETIGDVNDPLKIVQRNDTRPDAKLTKTDMAADLVAHGGASDVYNPEKGEGLTDMVKKKANKARELAPQSGDPA